MSHSKKLLIALRRWRAPGGRRRPKWTGRRL